MTPEDAVNDQQVEDRALRKAGVSDEEGYHVKLVRRSIDARGRQIWIRLRAEVWKGKLPAEPVISERFMQVDEKPAVIIVGAGPGGYFAALECLEQGLNPIVLDRGKDVRARRRDLRAIQQFSEVNPHSNYCFGEGGAGTYSDGKLYTRSHKRGSIEKVLHLLVEHGAKSDILVEAHPHIGSNKLPGIVANIRETITHHGGEVHFDTYVNDLIMEGDTIKGVRSEDGREWLADATILATGHSARDIFYLLDSFNIKLEAKPYALGVRIEHPQLIIDQAQYHRKERGDYLPASSYKLTCQVDKQGVFSFCMCPGGLVVPAATAPGEIVVNGMSLSRRDSPFANSGTVTAVDEVDFQPFSQHGIFAGLRYQQAVEQAVFNNGNGSQQAPAQRLIDFTKGKLSADLNKASYIPGLYAAPVHELLPKPVYERLRRGVLQFGKQMKGYLTQEANVIATESRTSSPIRIPRNRESYMHVGCNGLFPCGEGAGYAGGILSAAMDGQNVARAVAKYYQEKSR